MNEITAKDVVNVCNAKLLCGDINTVITTFSKDTRTISKGDMYVGITGENFNGNIFCKDALDLGAIGCIIDSDIDASILENYNSKVILKVENSVEALQKLANYKRSLYDIPVVAITGSVGKTSTKEMIASVLSTKYNVLKTEGNLNNQIGLPLTLLQLKDHTAVVVELGIGFPGEMDKIARTAMPTIAVVTNIGTPHIGDIGSREKILEEKLKVRDYLTTNGKLILNNDNDLLHKYYEENKADNILPFGIDEYSLLNPTNIVSTTENTTYEITINNSNYNITIPTPGKHFVYNSLAAILVGMELNIPVEDIIKGIESFKLTKGRMEIHHKKSGTIIINDAYNSSTGANIAALEYLREYTTRRRIAVLGDMLDLGEYSKELHEKTAYEAVRNKVDILVSVGPESKYTYQKALELGFTTDNAFWFSSNTEAIEKLNNLMQPNDVVLLKASHGLKFIEIFNGIME